MGLEDYQIVDIRRLRENFPEELQKYMDSEIASCFHLYCETFHAAGWTKVDDVEFIRWATKSPLENERA